MRRSEQQLRIPTGPLRPRPIPPFHHYHAIAAAAAGPMNQLFNAIPLQSNIWLCEIMRSHRI